MDLDDWNQDGGSLAMSPKLNPEDSDEKTSGNI
jgi:hypothetical protein